MTARVSHVAVGVSDADRSAAFYCAVLGLAVTSDRIEETSHPLLLKRRAVYCRWTDRDDGSYLVLDQQLDGAPGGGPAKLFGLGIHHVAFTVDDLDAAVLRVRAAGARVADPVTVDPEWTGDPDGPPVRTVLFRDPDGTFVQLDEYVPQPGPQSGRT